MQGVIFDQTNCCLKMHNFLCLKGTTEFLWKICMQAYQEQESPWVSEWLIFKTYHFMHI